jgi:hypothetical protein
MILLLADRINVSEGVFADLMLGHLPNVFAASGGRAAMRLEPGETIQRIAVKTVVIGGVIGSRLPNSSSTQIALGLVGRAVATMSPAIYLT